MKTNEISMVDRMAARREQMMRELQSDLADLVANGDMSAEQANEWANAKADQWAAE
jgi:hypothetical protein